MSDTRDGDDHSLRSLSKGGRRELDLPAQLLYLRIPADPFHEDRPSANSDPTREEKREGTRGLLLGVQFSFLFHLDVPSSAAAAAASLLPLGARLLAHRHLALVDRRRPGLAAAAAPALGKDVDPRRQGADEELEAGGRQRGFLCARVR
jgi:hypothetical protein